MTDRKQLFIFQNEEIGLQRKQNLLQISFVSFDNSFVVYICIVTICVAAFQVKGEKFPQVLLKAYNLELSQE